MRVRALCLSDDAGGYVGQRGAVNYQELALLDQDPAVGSRLINSFDYRMSAEEKALFAGKCEGKVVVIDVRDLEVFNSRLKVKRGKIVEVIGLNGNGKEGK